MRRPPTAWLASAALALALGAGPGHADEPRREAGDSPLRIFHVGALATAIPDFLPERLGLIRPDQVNDEAHPLFGGERDQGVLPLGTIDELVELLKGQVAADSWHSTSGVGIE